MKIIIDGEADLISLADGAALDQLAEQLEGTLLSSGRKSLKYVLDGRELALENLSEELSAGGETLEIQTMPLVDFIQAILGDMESGLRDSQEKMVELGERITLPNPSEAMEELMSWNEDMLAMCQNLGQLMHMLSLDQAELKSEGGLSLREILLSVESLCQKFTQALQADNFTAVADLCECEAVELLGAAQALLPKLKEKVADSLKA